jgi:glycosyltransferase involved in cell wall biosynthesis
MKIAVFHNLPSGGAKRALYEMVKRLSVSNTIDLYGYSSQSERYLDIRSFCRDVHYYWDRSIESTGYNIFSKIYLFFRLFLFSKRIATDIDSNEYDVVFIHHDIYVQSPLLMAFLKSRSVYYCQEPFRRVYEKQKLNDAESPRSFFADLLLRVTTDQFLKLIDRVAFNSADVVLANSHYSSTKIYEAYKIRPDVVYLGVDTNQFYYMPEVEKENIVLSVGRLHQSKGHDFAILSVSLVREDIRPILRVLCDSGNSNYENYLLDLAKNNNVSIIIETVPESEVCKVYNQSLLVISAQRYETLGLVALESMACSVPVVGVSEGGVQETIINNKTGFLVERNEELFANKIEQLLLDSELRKIFGSSGLKHVQSKWTWDLNITKITEKFKESL